MYDIDLLKNDADIEEVCACLSIPIYISGKTKSIACPDHQERHHDNCRLYGNRYYCLGHPRSPKLTVDVMTRNGRADLAFVNEFKRNGFCLQVGGKILYCSSVLSTLCTRCNVGGEGFLKNSVKRDTFLAEILSRSAKKAHIIARRSDDGIVKAYGVLGSALSPTGLARKTDQGEIDEQLVITKTDVFTVDDYLRTIYHTSLSDGEVTFYADL